MPSILKQVASLSVVLLLLFPNAPFAQTWNPNIGWKDSYAVGGKCYCDSNGYDHNLDSKFADTPIGPQNVVDICEAIEQVLGDGPVNGRIPYNDIQCGNGPPNDAPDEVGCPGRVDIGPEGCDQIGPEWDLATVYENLPNIGTELDSSNWALSASHNNEEVGLMVDQSLATRWATRTQQANGQNIVVDLRNPLSFNRIELNAASNPNDYPRAYSVFVSANGSNWGSAVVSGNGDQARTIIELPEQSARYIRITQTGSDDFYWWSIHELKIFGTSESQTNTPTTIVPAVDLIL